MEIALIYFITIIFANAIGALSGMGGGVIIKPVLDYIGAHDLLSISFYSSVAVLTMSIVSTLKQWKNGAKVQWKLAVIVSIGSILGGLLGNTLFEFLVHFFMNDGVVQSIQIVITILSLGFAFIYTKFSIFVLNLRQNIWYFSIGLFLGFLSTLLGIGGGPINVAFLILFFGISMKSATLYSIITILFSQMTKLISTGFSVGYEQFDLSMLYAIIPAAIIGGYIGAFFSFKLSNKSVATIYQAVVLFVILLNVTNAIQLYFY